MKWVRNSGKPFKIGKTPQMIIETIHLLTNTSLSFSTNRLDLVRDLYREFWEKTLKTDFSFDF
jgi:hypothetical protein